jgi:hypothetical protein
VCSLFFNAKKWNHIAAFAIAHFYVLYDFHNNMLTAFYSHPTCEHRFFCCSTSKQKLWTLAEILFHFPLYVYECVCHSPTLVHIFKFKLSWAPCGNHVYSIFKQIFLFYFRAFRFSFLLFSFFLFLNNLNYMIWIQKGTSRKVPK